jgi:TolA-binding protein
MKKILFLSAAILLGSPIESSAGHWDVALGRASQGKTDWSQFLKSPQYDNAHRALSGLKKIQTILDGLNQAYEAWRSPSTPSKPSASSAFSMSGASSVPFSPPASTFSPGGASSVVSSVAGDGRGSIPEILKLDQEIEGLQDKIDELEDEDDDVKNEATIKTLKKELRAKRKERKAFAADGAGAGAGGAVAPAPVAESPYSAKGKDGKIYSVPKGTDLKKKVPYGFPPTLKNVSELLAMIKTASSVTPIKMALGRADIELTEADAPTATAEPTFTHEPLHREETIEPEYKDFDILTGLVTVQIEKSIPTSTLKVSGDNLNAKKSALRVLYDQTPRNAYEEAKKLAEKMKEELNTDGKKIVGDITTHELVIVPKLVLEDENDAKEMLNFTEQERYTDASRMTRFRNVEGEKTVKYVMERLNAMANEKAEISILNTLESGSIRVRINLEAFKRWPKGFTVTGVAPMNKEIGGNTVQRLLGKISLDSPTLMQDIGLLESAGITVTPSADFNAHAYEERIKAVQEDNERKKQAEEVAARAQAEQKAKELRDALDKKLNFRGLPGSFAIKMGDISTTIDEAIAVLPSPNDKNQEVFARRLQQIQNAIDFEVQARELGINLNGKSPDFSATIGENTMTVRAFADAFYKEKQEIDKESALEKERRMNALTAKIEELNAQLAS